MSFELSFSEDFFTGEYGHEQPCSILEAAERLTPDERQRLAKDLALWQFPDNHAGRDSKIWPTCESFAWDLVDLARQINTCDQLSSPVTVYLDPDGWSGLDVYDSEREEVAA